MEGQAPWQRKKTEGAPNGNDAAGSSGGMQGGTGRAVVNPGTPGERALAPLSDGTILTRGDILRLETGGGGGWGVSCKTSGKRKDSKERL